MTALHLASTGPGHHTSIRTADGDVERAWGRLCQARDAWCRVTPGDTDALFATTDAWVAAIGEYESARVKLARAESQAQGEAWLWALGVSGG